MNTANIVILEKIKELRHLLVLQCQNLREAGNESDDMNALCNVSVAMERLMALVVDDEPDLCQVCGAEKQLVKSGSMWLCCDCAAVEHANT